MDFGFTESPRNTLSAVWGSLAISLVDTYLTPGGW